MTTDAVIETDVAAAQRPPAGDADPAGSPRQEPADADEGLRPLPVRWASSLAARAGAMPLSGWVTLLIVAGCVVFVGAVLRFDHVLSDTTPTGGDMSAHVWGPAFLKDHLLTKGRLVGWSPDWYAGFPAFQFYMVPPFLVIALLSFVLPYGVAFKLVAVSGCLSLPVAAWAFGRLNRLPFPVPALAAIGATIFLFDRSYAIYGGNIASTLAGEFAFGISLSLAILYLGLLGHVLLTGRHRGWAALVLALAALCHVIPFLFAVLGTAVWMIVRPGVARLRDVWFVGLVGGLLAAWWYIPFYVRSPFMNDMGWSKLTDWDLLFQRTINDSTNSDYPTLWVAVVFAALAVVVSVALRQRAGIYLGVLAAGCALAFRFAPETRLWNARILPFYYLLIYMLALVGIGLLVSWLARVFAAGDRPLETAIKVTLALGTAVVLYGYLALPMQLLPLGGMDETGQTYEAGIGPFKLRTKDQSYLSGWALWNFEGLEHWEDKPSTGGSGNEAMVPTYDRAYPEFRDLILTLQRVAAEHGCGRAMWEYEEEHNRYGSTMEPMMLPHFTDGCIGSMEGLYMEASATTPYHFINSTQLSKQGSAPQRELPYATMPPNQADFDQGIGHLKMLGSKYYLAIDDLMKERAAANPDLRKVADSGPWSIYLVPGAEIVEPLTAEPVVIEGQGGANHDWLETAACWYVNEAAWPVPITDDGPDGWQRITRDVHPAKALSAQEKCSAPDGGPWGWLTNSAPEHRPLPEVKVSNIREGDDTISFDVDRTGVPVVVKTSYFPNWQATGADGPYRATPNVMVVIPTSNHVELRYGVTSIETFSYGLAALGLGGLALLFGLRTRAPAPVSRFWAPVDDPAWAPPAGPGAPPAGDDTAAQPPTGAVTADEATAEETTPDASATARETGAEQADAPHDPERPERADDPGGSAPPG